MIHFGVSDFFIDFYTPGGHTTIFTDFSGTVESVGDNKPKERE